MGTTHHLHPDDTDAETTTEIRARRQRAADQERADRLTRQIRNSRPSRRYTQITIVVGVSAVLDWVAVAVHSVTTRGYSPNLGTHQALVATLTMVATFLGVCWVRWHHEFVRDAKRDERDELRHKELMERIDDATRAAVNREWKSYVHGIRDGATRVSGDAVSNPPQSGSPAENGSIIPFSRNGTPRRPNLG